MTDKPTQQAIGIFTTDTQLIVHTWDSWLAQATGIPAELIQLQPLALIVPDLEARGLLRRFQQVLDDGVVVVLASALHHYLLPCPPQTPSRHFEMMQQHVTIAPLRDHEQIVGTLVTIEDITARREREYDLADALASPDEYTRLRAAQTLADKAEAPAQMLIETLGDSSWRVRQVAASGLAQRADSQMIGQLASALRSDHRNPSVLNSALQALAFSKEDSSGPLIGLLHSADADLRGYVVLALGEHNSPQVRQALSQALADPDMNVRYHAIEALGKVQAIEAVDKLIRIAESDDFFLAFPALDALAKIGDPHVAARIVPLLGNQLLALPAADALGQLGDLEVVAPLATLLNMPAPPTITIVQALAAIYDRYEVWYGEGALIIERLQQMLTAAGVHNLINALTTTQAEQLPLLAQVLGWLEGPAIERELTRLLAQPAVRAEIVDALVKQGTPVIELLIEQLDAEDQETRLAAMIALGRIGTPRAVPALISLLSAEAQLASVAASALAKIGDRRAFEPLLGLLGQPSASVRQAAIGALNSLGHPDLAARAGALLQADDPYVRESAVKIVGYFGYPAFVPAMLERCSDPDQRVRSAAIEHLPFFEHPGVIQALSDGLQDRIPAVRIASARAFGYIDDPQALHHLIRALEDQDAWVRYNAVRSIGRKDAIEALDALLLLAQTDVAQQVRIIAVEVLGRIAGASALPLMSTLATSDDLALARAAISALGTINHPDAQALLLKHLDTSDPARRVAVIAALGTYHSVEALLSLKQFASMEADSPLAQAAVAALARVPTSESINILVELISQPARREAIIATLAHLGAEQIDLIGRGLEHRQVEVRRAIVEVLERMKHYRASEYIGAALGDPEPTVRLAAAVALGRLGSQAANRLLEALAQSDPDAAIRQAARTALQR